MKNLNITIKPMESENEIKGKAYVHWKGWHEAYSGIVNQAYLDNFTLEKCTKIAFRWPDDILIAEDGGQVIGFAGYGPYRGGSLPETGEVYGIYILKEYYDQGVGYKLISQALEKLAEYKNVALWVLEDNSRAIKFYEKLGFRFDGTKQRIMLGTEVTEIRMILKR